MTTILIILGVLAVLFVEFLAYTKVRKDIEAATDVGRKRYIDVMDKYARLRDIAIGCRSEIEEARANGRRVVAELRTDLLHVKGQLSRLQSMADIGKNQAEPVIQGVQALVSKINALEDYLNVAYVEQSATVEYKEPHYTKLGRKK